ncbi:FAD binding domain-containing protein [Aspergillus ambiguus]|uniref:FAD binding domain-containing protein n=1 Tax=Aspergillus ambiguus TaxID=176160 RepID=UPI003CCDC454
MNQNQQPIIIVGGNVVGLSAALSLAVHRVPSIVIEKHQAISKHPRAIGFTPRTMEIFRAFGVVDRIPQVPRDFELKRARVESLTGQWYENTSWEDTGKEAHSDKPRETPTDKESPQKEYSQYLGAAIPQDQLETILEEAAIQHGVDIRRGLTVVRVDQDATGVAATVMDAHGEAFQIRGLYLIAADGNRSGIREQLSIPRHGRGHLQTMRSVLFRAALEEYCQGIQQFAIEQPDLKAFLTTYSDGRWVLMFYDDIDRDEKTLLSDIHKAVGRGDVTVEIITTGRWELAALVADRFQSGRIFLAGDAAHTLPPNRGGYGANTGIHDVDNLAWKLAAVLAGQSRLELLDTYEIERRPVAQLRHDQIFVRSDYKIHLNEKSVTGVKLDNDAMEFGEIYKSRGFVGVSDDLPLARKPDEWAGQPGTHIPHFWVQKNDKALSIQDLIGRVHWALVSVEKEWSEVVAWVNARSPVQVKCVQIGGDVDIADVESFCRAMGLSDQGASLIRPDGYIAWRTKDMPSEPLRVLHEVLSQVAFTKGH